MWWTVVLLLSQPPAPDPVLSMVVEHCGQCHTRSSPNAKAGALAVFDLDADKPWSLRLSDDQLEAAVGRMRGKVTAEQLAPFRAYVDEAQAKLRASSK